jgi:hypothetical protein
MADHYFLFSLYMMADFIPGYQASLVPDTKQPPEVILRFAILDTKETDGYTHMYTYYPCAAANIQAHK